jgi:glycosyltransferase involved in cell wall biosynthesis
MRILMVTNTYRPFGGGVARSVDRFTEAFRRRGHDVLVVAPEAGGPADGEPGVLRVPSIHRPLKRPFAIALPVPGLIARGVDAFDPDLVHSHHPFLLGDDALRLAASRRVPLVFTHHTQYGMYILSRFERGRRLARFVTRLAVEYARLCQWVVAPSESTARMLRERGVHRPMSVVPTGIDIGRFRRGDGPAARARLGIPAEAPLVGYVGRLGREKNLQFLARAVAGFLAQHRDARFLVVGDGEAEADLVDPLSAAGLAKRLHRAGRLEGQDLVDAYHAIDVFAFASRADTQAMVLAEAMAAGVPVVALQAPGAADIVHDGANGRLVAEEDPAAFAAALADLTRADASRREALAHEARTTAEGYGMDRCAERLLDVYRRARQTGPDDDPPATSTRWDRLQRALAAEWDLLAAGGEAVSDALRGLL